MQQQDRGSVSWTLVTIDHAQRQAVLAVGVHRRHLERVVGRLDERRGFVACGADQVRRHEKCEPRGENENETPLHPARGLASFQCASVEGAIPKSACSGPSS